MKLRKISIIRPVAALIAALAVIMSLIGIQHVSAAVYDGMNIEYVESIDNMQYPSSDKYWSLADMEGYRRIEITEPTMLKTIIKWESDEVQSVKLEYTRDIAGIDVVGKTKEIRDSGDHIIHLLDKGTYYVHYRLNSSSSSNENVIIQAGMCILGQKLGSTEEYAVSSFTSANPLEDGKTVKGALSITAPIDYYTFTLNETGTVKLAFSFGSFNDFGQQSGGRIDLYDKDQARVAAQNYDASSSAGNVLEKELEPGKYYVALSGVESSTVLSMQFTKKAEAVGPEVSDMKIEYVESLDNMQYPSSDKYWTLTDAEGYRKIKVTEPTMVKTLIKWESGIQSATLEYVRDPAGLDAIDKKEEVRDSGNGIIHLLDKGVYYVHYKLTSASQDDKDRKVQAGMCILGQKIGSTEKHPVSSFKSANPLKNGKTVKGALSVTAPIDYYKFTIKKDGVVKLTYSFGTFTDMGQMSGGKIELYDVNQAKIASQNYNSSSEGGCAFEKALAAGTYYVSLSGAETSTVISMQFTKKPIDLGPAYSTGKAKVIYTSALDNAHYPNTDQFSSALGTEGWRKFTIKKPTIIKVYMTWDTTAFSRAKIWLSRDDGGIDRIGGLSDLNGTTDYIYHLLDPGTYYVNFQLEGSREANGDEIVGVCILGQKVYTTEEEYASSFKKPTLMTSGKKQRGFLSLTAPVDYYKFTIAEDSNVKFSFDFATLNKVQPYSGAITIYTKSKEFVHSQNYSLGGVEYNEFTLHLKKGTYYITLSGAETYTTVTYKAYSTVPVFKEKTLEDGSVRLSFKCPTYFKEVMMRAAKEAKESVNETMVWNTYDELNCIVRNNSVIVKKNGWYTFRMEDSFGNKYIYTVKVKGVKEK